MSAELVFYTYPMSRGRAARWLLEEVGRAYRMELREFGTTMMSPEYLALNPMGKVPALSHGAVLVRRERRSVPISPLPSPSPAWRRPPMIQGAVPIIGGSSLVSGRWRPPGPIRHAASPRLPTAHAWLAMAARIRCCRGSKALSVAKKYLAADSFTAAAPSFGAQLGFGRRFDMSEKRPVLVAYAERLTARPAAMWARETDDALGASRPTA